MNKKINKHIQNQDYVKVYIAEKETQIANFGGFIVDQDDKFVLMCDTHDLFFDGMVILRKSDMVEIRHSDNEKFLQKIFREEKLTESFMARRNSVSFSLDSLPKMFAQLQKLNLPLIVECNYGKDERFVIGPVEEIKDKKVKIKHFNARGEFDLKAVILKYKEITFFRFNDPYVDTFFKYAFKVE